MDGCYCLYECIGDWLTYHNNGSILPGDIMYFSMGLEVFLVLMCLDDRSVV